MQCGTSKDLLCDSAVALKKVSGFTGHELLPLYGIMCVLSQT